MGAAAGGSAGMVMPGIGSLSFIGAICACAGPDTSKAALAANIVEFFMSLSLPAGRSLSIYDQGVYYRR